jgi:hypothetical protein
VQSPSNPHIEDHNEILYITDENDILPFNVRWASGS